MTGASVFVWGMGFEPPLPLRERDGVRGCPIASAKGPGAASGAPTEDQHDMRAVIQRVNYASVKVDGETVGEIGPGLALLVGITHEDGDEDIKYLVDKTVNMRIFPAESGDSGFDRSVLDIGGSLLLVSQFTLYATTRKGRRPGFTDAAPPEVSEPMFERVVEAFRATGAPVETGVFGAMMQVALENSGPATFILDTADRLTPRRG